MLLLEEVAAGGGSGSAYGQGDISLKQWHHRAEDGPSLAKANTPPSVILVEAGELIVYKDRRCHGLSYSQLHSALRAVASSLQQTHLGQLQLKTLSRLSFLQQVCLQ